MTRKQDKRMPRRGGRTARHIGVLVLLAASLGGCMATGKREDVTGAVPNDYRLRHPIAVKEAEQTLDLFVGARRGGLTPTQRSEVLAFAQSWHSEATGGVIIDVPAGTPNARAAHETAQEVRAILTGAGIPPRAIQLRPSRSGSPTSMATLRVNYPRMAAKAGPCGLWPDDLGPTLDPQYEHNRPYWNLGCATQRNLASMVDNPADLVQPRSETPLHAGRRSTALDKYRKGESTATTYPDSKATVSDVAK
jgi:pilus assembly protein CpaD